MEAQASQAGPSAAETGQTETRASQKDESDLTASY